MVDAQTVQIQLERSAPPLFCVMAATSKPSTPLPVPPGVVPSESRDDFNALVDSEAKVDERDPNNIVKEVTTSTMMLQLNYSSSLIIQGVLTGQPEVTSLSPEASGEAIMSGTPSNAWISPEKHAQKFDIDFSKLCLYTTYTHIFSIHMHICRSR